MEHHHLSSPRQPEFASSRRQFIQGLSLAALTGVLAASRTPALAQEASQSPAPAGPGPFYLPPQAPLSPGEAGLDIRTWVRSAQTNGQFSCVESAVRGRQMGPAPHVHAELDELMYVLEGTATVWMDGEPQEIPAGGWHLRPRKIPHTFWNGFERPLRFIDMYFNQNFEDFLEELFHRIMPDMARRHLSPEDPGIAARLADLYRRFGVVSFPEKRQPLVERYGLVG
jgi:mannose-6-phosphate isomerase-like protein (cupin superfamily)